MSNPSQSEQLRLSESFDLISCTTILGTFYGIAFALYYLCAWLLYLRLQDPDKRRQAGFTLGYISLVLLCTTAYLALNARVIQLAYINHDNYPGGPLAYEISYNSDINSYRTAGRILDLIVEVLTMAIQIWRLWVIWSGTQYAVAVTVLPLLLLLSCIALYLPIGIAPAMSPVDQLGISPWSAIAMATASYGILSAFTILVTGLIISRILLVRRCNIKSTGTFNTACPYMSIIAMLIESYALESAWSIASAILNGLGSPSAILFMENDSTIKVIAYFLVVYRVASGRAWDRDTERKLTSLQWNHDAQTATDEASGIRSRVSATTVAVAVGSRPVSHSESAV